MDSTNHWKKCVYFLKWFITYTQKDFRAYTTQLYSVMKEDIRALTVVHPEITGVMQSFNASLLATLLRNYGISSTRTSAIRGYKRSDFNDAWSRYAPAEPVTPVTVVTPYDGNDGNDGKPRVIQQTIQNHAQLIQ